MSRFFERYEAEASRFFDEVISKDGTPGLTTINCFIASASFRLTI